jgi:hypothetical protein
MTEICRCRCQCSFQEVCSSITQKNPQANNLQNSRFQKHLCNIWWGRKATINIGPHLLINSVITTWTCISRHVQLQCITSQPRLSIAMLCSLINVYYISVQGFELFISKLNKIHVPLKQQQHSIHLMLWCGLESPVQRATGQYLFGMSLNNNNNNNNNNQWHYSPDRHKPPLIWFHSLS